MHRPFEVEIEDSDTLELDGMQVMISSFPGGEVLTSAMSTRDREIVKRFVSSGRSVIYRSSGYVFVSSLACWYSNKTPEACRCILSVIDCENVSVNYYAASLPYLNILDRYSFKLGCIPRSVCLGIYRLTYIVEDDCIFFRTLHNLIPLVHGSNFDDMMISSFCLMPVTTSYIPKMIRCDAISKAEEVLSVTIDKESMRTIMWCVGNSLSDPVDTPRLLFFYGEGGDGKSVTINTLIASLPGIVGSLTLDYVGRISSQLKEIDVQRLMSSRFVCYGDVVLNKHRQLNESFLKIMSGNDLVSTSTMTGTLQCAGLFATNSLWIPYPSILMPWFSRRVVCIRLSRPSGKLPPVITTFDDSDILRFIGRCIAIRKNYEGLPITTHNAMITVFGQSARSYCRGIAFDERSTYYESLAATYVVSSLSTLPMVEMLRLFNSLSPDLLVGPHAFTDKDSFIPMTCAIRGMRIELTPY